MSFLQAAPQLPHPLHGDHLLQHLLVHTLPKARRAATMCDLEALAQYSLMVWQRERSNPAQLPVHTPWDAWGERVDRVSLTTTWREGAAIATRRGLLTAGHDPDAGASARLEQFARIYVYHMASAFYTCPLAMTDGAVAALEASGNRELIQRAVPHFLSRDADSLWLSGQWMTETIGGSDVGNTQTRARRDAEGQWRLYGRKWFTSAIVGETALALARPEEEGNDLALFYVETRDADGAWNGLTIDRIKDKLGNRELPTAEIHLHGVPAWPVGELAHGVRQIAPVLTTTRTWNAVCAVASSARCLALAGDYARRRTVFGKPLAIQPLHRRTLADLQAEHAAGFMLAFHVVELMGRVDSGHAPDGERELLRLLTPLAKLWTGKLAVRIASETLECFGGNGYIEDTGLPQLLRDAQVYSIWEGTTNVLSLDLLRVLDKYGLAPLYTAVEAWLAGYPAESGHTGPIGHALDAVREHLDRPGTSTEHPQCARSIAITLARTCAAALLARAAARDAGNGFLSAARDLFLAHGLNRLSLPETEPDLTALLTPAPAFHA